MKKTEPNAKRWGLTLSLMLFVFAVIMTAIMISGILVYVLHKAGALDSFMERFAVIRQRAELIEGPPPHGGVPFLGQLLGLMVFSALLALALTWFFGRRALNPIRKVIDATRKVAAGEFNVQVELKGVAELEELSRSFNKMTRELASIETMRSDFVNGISHEFKTPIASIEGFAEVLQNGNLSAAEQQECLAFIISESKRLAALSTNILALSKYENTEIIAEKTIFPLDEQIRRVIALVEPRWSEKGIGIQVDMENGVAFEGNEDLTQQIWLNLLDNAIRFTPQGGKIHIALQQQNGGVRFRIQDSGIGMDAQAAARCFDKFYQADESKSKSGNGLGLAIVKRIVDLHGGVVEVRSEPGRGSAFTVIL